MKTILLVILGLVVCSQAVEVAENMEKCQATLIGFVSGSTSSISQILKACGLSEMTQKLTLTEECLNDLSKANDILQLIFTQNNKAKLALVQKSCHFLNVVNIQSLMNPSNSSGVCLQAAYQLSLDVQTMWQNIRQGNYPVAFANFQKFLDDVPNTLDTCGDHTLADKIRKEFPSACLRSFDKLAKQISKIQHNFDHLQWLVKNWKEIVGIFNEVRKSCPVFA